MKVDDPNLDRLLHEVRRAKRQRKQRGAVLAPLMLLAFLALILLSMLPVPPIESTTVISPPENTDLSPSGTLAVLVEYDGFTFLQELGPEELGHMELDFSLEPIFSHRNGFE